MEYVEATSPVRADVARAALQLVDDWGLAALTPLSVANELGCTVEAIEERWPDHATLLDLTLDLVYAQVDLQPMDVPWSERLRRYSNSFREALLKHPNTAVPIATRPIVSESSLRLAEQALGQLTDVGFDPIEANRVLLVIVSFIIGHVLTELGTANEIDGHMEHNHASPLVEQFRKELDDRTPIAKIVLNESNDRDLEFELGLELLIGGLERRLLHS